MAQREHVHVLVTSHSVEEGERMSFSIHSSDDTSTGSIATLLLVFNMAGDLGLTLRSKLDHTADDVEKYMGAVPAVRCVMAGPITPESADVKALLDDFMGDNEAPDGSTPDSTFLTLLAIHALRRAEVMDGQREEEANS
jgi:hypothetical protein